MNLYIINVRNAILTLAMSLLCGAASAYSKAPMKWGMWKK